MRYFEFESPLGLMLACMEGETLKGLWFDDQRYFPEIPDEAEWSKPDEKLVAAVEAYCKGELESFDLICQPEGTDFQKLIWEILLTIPYGVTMTYKEVAREAANRLGKPSMSAQATGNAIGKNPISMIIPCHRVIGSNGSLTGYAGGLHRKEALLRLEGLLL